MSLHVKEKDLLPQPFLHKEQPAQDASSLSGKTVKVTNQFEKKKKSVSKNPVKLTPEQEQICKSTFSFSLDLNKNPITHQQILTEQERLNGIRDKEVIQSCFYKRATKFSKKDLFLKENLFQFVLLLNHPSPFVKYNFFNGRPDGECQILELSECNCPFGSRNADERKQTFNVREKIEQRVLEKAETLLQEKKGEKIVYTSLGSYGCLQDFVLLSKLILMGACEIDIHLADLQFQYENCDPLKKNFSEFFEQFPGTKFKVFFHSSFEDFAKLEITSDLVLAIDWEAVKELKEEDKIQILVSKKGFSYYNKKEPYWKNFAICQLHPLDNQKY